MTVQCCKCKRIRRDTEWTAFTDDSCGNDHFTHSYCPVCAEEFHMELFSAQASRTTIAQAHALVKTLQRPR